jgi:hypothetical protein
VLNTLKNILQFFISIFQSTFAIMDIDGSIIWCGKKYHIKDTLEKYSVVNLSSHNLNDGELLLLSKGLNFCPTPERINKSELMSDFFDFARKMRIQFHFNKCIDEEENIPQNSQSKDTTLETLFNLAEENNWPTSHTDSQSSSDAQLEKPSFQKYLENRFKKKSTWCPPKGANANLEAFLSCIREELFDLKPKRVQDNLLGNERRAIRSLTNNKNIVIKKADKGSAVVVMDIEDYITEAERQLNDVNFYIHKNQDLTTTHTAQIIGILSKLLENKEITESVFQQLSPIGSRTSRFYFLPKIHKQIVKGRPIISGNGSPTEKISEFVDEHIKHIVPLLTSYIKDTTDFVNKIESLPKMPPGTILVTMDVSSLYTCIPHDEGIIAIAEYHKKYKKGVLTTKSVCTLLEAVLKKNNFEINNKHYLQIGGTAMGTRLAPSYANIFMGWLENQYLSSCPVKPKVYYRYIDDIFMIFQNEIEVQQFSEFCNNFHKTIKFTTEFSTEGVSFLDTQVKLDINGKVYTTLYTKPTDTHNYLLPTSSHPHHCVTNTPYSQFLRLRRNCHHDKDFLKEVGLMAHHYIQRGYNENKVINQAVQALKKDRATLLNPPAKSNKNNSKISQTVRFITTYNPRVQMIYNIICKHWYILEANPQCRQVFKDKPQVVFRRAKSLKDHLVRAKVDYSNKPKNTIQTFLGLPEKHGRAKFSCHRFPCKYCKTFPNTGGNFTATTTSRGYLFKAEQNCCATNVIYCITCKKCKKQYVGETLRQFRERLREHFYSVLNFDPIKSKNMPVARHFNSPNHTVADFQCQIIEIILKNPKLPETTRFRKGREMFWIHKLRTISPEGINIMES